MSPSHQFLHKPIHTYERLKKVEKNFEIIFACVNNEEYGFERAGLKTLGPAFITNIDKVSK